MSCEIPYCISDNESKPECMYKDECPNAPYLIIDGDAYIDFDAKDKAENAFAGGRFEFFRGGNG